MQKSSNRPWPLFGFEKEKSKIFFFFSFYLTVQGCSLKIFDCERRSKKERNFPLQFAFVLTRRVNSQVRTRLEQRRSFCFRHISQIWAVIPDWEIRCLELSINFPLMKASSCLGLIWRVKIRLGMIPCRLLIAIFKIL